MGDAVAYCDRIGNLYVFAGDTQDADRIVRAVRDQREVTFLTDVEP
jgi:hypothetical protein